MIAEAHALSIVTISGLRPDSLGHYLASLGLLRLLARKWPSVRVAWRDDVLHVVGPATLDNLLDALVDVATKRTWTTYEREWAETQKKSTKAKSGTPLAQWQGAAKEDALEIFAAHAVPAARVQFNPLLGSGGNAGKRVFSDGWKKAVDALAPPQSSKTRKNETEDKKRARQAKDITMAADEAARKRAELKALLCGEPLSWMLEKLNAASWFSNANKLYNSGQSPYREGLLSPWAMALACEGLAFFAGSVSRRLGSRAKTVGAFPFVTHAAAPTGTGVAGLDLAELWAPLWHRPLALPEAKTLFARGRAEARGRGALTPSAFATAIIERGVDAGITGFVRFSLGRTTSSNTFEPHFEGRFGLTTPKTADPNNTVVTCTPSVLGRILALIECLPRDQKKGQRWRYVGLRGPIERAVIDLAAAPSDLSAARVLLDAVVASLDRVDRNRTFRKGRVTWKPLPVAWLPALFDDESPTVEARLAMALVSGFPRSRPFTLYRFGVEWVYGRFEHTERPPARWVFGPGPLSRVLATVLHRRVFDWEKNPQTGEDKEASRRDDLLLMSATDVGRWLAGTLDETLLARWIDRFALFDWRQVPAGLRAITCGSETRLDVTGAVCLFGLLGPLFDLRPLRRRYATGDRELLDPKTRARSPAAARVLASLVGSGQLDAAVRLAASRYAMAGTPLVRTSTSWGVDAPDRLLASFLIQVTDHDRTNLIERWLRPRRRQGETSP